MLEESKSKLEEGCRKFDIDLSNDQISKFFEFYDMLIEYNKIMNLTSITEINDVIDKHFIDSIKIIIHKLSLKELLDIFQVDKN